MRSISTQRWTAETYDGLQTAAWTWQLADKNASCASLAEALAPLTGEVSTLAEPAVENRPASGNHQTAQPSPAIAPAMAVLAQSPLAAFLLFAWRSIAGRLHRNQRTSARPAMHVIGYLSLGGRRTLALIEIDGQQYLIGGSADQVSTIVAVSPGAISANAAGKLTLAPADEERA